MEAVFINSQGKNLPFKQVRKFVQNLKHGGPLIRRSAQSDRAGEPSPCQETPTLLKNVKFLQHNLRSLLQVHGQGVHALNALSCGRTAERKLM
jgi:hypothetical protein